MCGLKVMVWEGFVFDVNEGICFYGCIIKDCQCEFFKGIFGIEMFFEVMFWFFFIGQVFFINQVCQFFCEFVEKVQIFVFVFKMFDDFFMDFYFMIQFVMVVFVFNYEFKFVKVYEQGLNKVDYWEFIFDDCIFFFVKLFIIVVKIYQNFYCGGGVFFVEVDFNQDWSYNFVVMFGKGGKENENFQDFFCFYFVFYGDYEGGNVFVYVIYFVGSVFSDLFFFYSVGFQGFVGFFYGLDFFIGLIVVLIYL